MASCRSRSDPLAPSHRVQVRSAGGYTQTRRRHRISLSWFEWTRLTRKFWFITCFLRLNSANQGRSISGYRIVSSPRRVDTTLWMCSVAHAPALRRQVRDEAKRQNQYDTDFRHHRAQFARAEPGRVQGAGNEYRQPGAEEADYSQQSYPPWPLRAGVRGRPD